MRITKIPDNSKRYDDLNYLRKNKRLLKKKERKLADFLIKLYNRRGKLSDEYWSKITSLAIPLRYNGSSYHVYFITSNDAYVKIGYSNYPYRRMKDLQTGNPMELSMDDCIWMPNRSVAGKIEKRVHKEYETMRTLGEWFDISILPNAKNYTFSLLKEYYNERI